MTTTTNTNSLRPWIVTEERHEVLQRSMMLSFEAMVERLRKYIEKHGENAMAAKIEKDLKNIMDYFNAIDGYVQFLHQWRDESFQRGIEEGKRLERQSRGVAEIHRRDFDKETVRSEFIKKAMHAWPELY